MSNRDRWPSKTLFIFAAVGSAIGLGNIWRFPYLVGKYGGGAFLFPYLIALFVVGFPLLIMEFALGQKMQQGAVGSMKKLDRRLSGIGLGSVLSSFGVSAYYAVIMSWCLLYIIYSFHLDWGNDTNHFFFHQVLGVSESPGQIEGFSTSALFALLITWILVYFCIWKGIKSVSRVVQITMPLPVLLLLILLLRTLFLPGATDGVAYFLTPNFHSLLDSEVWMAAVTQIFFTLSLGFGVMITYASYQKKNSDIVMSALITSIADVSIALVAGLVVFATLGYMAEESGISISELASSGPALAFVVFPKALSTIPWAPFFSVSFFIMLATLAIDSLFSLTEAVAAVFEDHFPKISKKMIVFFVCLTGYLGGLVFTTSAGIYYLDISDHFLTHYGLVLMGLLQTLSVGWVYGAEKMRHYINDVSDMKIGKWWNTLITFIIPFSLMLFLGKTTIENLSVTYGGYPSWSVWSFGWGIIGLLLLTSFSYSVFQSRSKENNLR
jgi:neurotransmitter:Na+ symporter, NSS family